MKIYTSYYGNMRKLAKSDIVPVGISIGVPNFFKGNTMKYLAPRRDMLNMKKEKYIPEYLKILENVSIDKIREDVGMISKIHGGKDIALLCFEKSGDFCHRRLFAEWLKEKTGYEIEEFGYKGPKEPEVKQNSLF